MYMLCLIVIQTTNCWAFFLLVKAVMDSNFHLTLSEILLYQPRRFFWELYLVSNSMNLFRVDSPACSCHSSVSLYRARSTCFLGWQWKYNECQVLLEINGLVVVWALPFGGLLQGSWVISAEVQWKVTAGHYKWTQIGPNLHPTKRLIKMHYPDQ